MANERTILAVSLRSTLQSSPPGVGGQLNTVSFRNTLSMLTGIGADQADLVYAGRRELASATAEDLDLAGVLLGGAGAITIAKLKAVLIVAVSTNTTTLAISRPAMNGSLIFAAASDALAPIGRKGIFLWADPDDGIVVTAGSADLITVTNSAGATAKYDVVILGTSA